MKERGLIGGEEIRVSVVITSYNQKDYLEESIQSLIKQTVKPCEIIIADDCSTDGTVDMIKKYIKAYPGFIKGVFQDKNTGIPRNRNSALEKVTGSHVAILDGDDLFEPNKIKMEIEELKKKPEVKVVYSNVGFIGPNGEELGVRDKGLQPSGNIFPAVVRGKFGLLRSMLIHHSSLKEIGFLDDQFPKYDGFELTIRLSKNYRFSYIEEPLVRYRIHPESDSRSLGKEDHFRDLNGIYNKLNPLLSDLPVLESWKIRLIWFFRLLYVRSPLFDYVEGMKKKRNFQKKDKPEEPTREIFKRNG